MFCSLNQSIDDSPSDLQISALSRPGLEGTPSVIQNIIEQLFVPALSASLILALKSILAVAKPLAQSVPLLSLNSALSTKSFRTLSELPGLTSVQGIHLALRASRSFPELFPKFLRFTRNDLPESSAKSCNRLKELRRIGPRRFSTSDPDQETPLSVSPFCGFLSDLEESIRTRTSRLAPSCLRQVCR